jgi:hypothetical protein
MTGSYANVNRMDGLNDVSTPRRPTPRPHPTPRSNNVYTRINDMPRSNNTYTRLDDHSNPHPTPRSNTRINNEDIFHMLSQTFGSNNLTLPTVFTHF